MYRRFNSSKIVALGISIDLAERKQYETLHSLPPPLFPTKALAEELHCCMLSVAMKFPIFKFFYTTLHFADTLKMWERYVHGGLEGCSVFTVQ